MGLGTNWPFDPLKAGECIISSLFDEKNVNDTIYLSFAYTPIKALVLHYNDEVRKPGDKFVGLSSNRVTNLPCTIVEEIDQSYGKSGKDQYENAIIMDYNNFYPYFTQYFP